MMDGRHRAGTGSDCAPRMAFSWSPPPFPLTSSRQLFFLPKKPRGLQRASKLLKQTSPQDHVNILGHGLILQHHNRCGVGKTRDFWHEISEPQSHCSSAHSSERLFQSQNKPCAFSPASPTMLHNVSRVFVFHSYSAASLRSVFVLWHPKYDI